MSLGKKKILHQGAAAGLGNTDNFDIDTYTGTGTTNERSEFSFQPDFVWIKNRTTTDVGTIHNSISGAGYYLIPSTINAQSTLQTDVFTSFDSDGFTVGTSSATNGNTNNIVAWAWKAGGTGVSNTDGTTTSTVSANQDAGFSIVKFTATATNINVGHGLSSAPEMILYKNISVADNWYVYHKDLSSPNTQYLNLNTTSAAITNASNNFSSVGATTFTSFLAGSGDIVCYCFHSVDGKQKVGYFNQVSGTTTVSTGFRPRFLMMKRTDNTGDWYMFDSLRGDADLQLLANENYAEGATSGYTMAFNDDGFVLTVAAGSYDIDYIYLAIA